MKLLLVDDEVLTVGLMKTGFDWGAMGVQEVCCAYNGRMARETFRQRQVDICICDIEMPKESGLELIRWIQKHYSRTVNMILTGHADFSYAQSAVSLNVFRFLVKPVLAEELKAALGAAAEKIETEARWEQQRKYGELLYDQEDSIADARLEALIRRAKREMPHKGGRGSAVKAVECYIEQHFNQPIHRKDIEELVHLNQDYISRLFRESTGYSLTEYIQFFRMVVAKALLSETVLTIGEISAQVGYDSAAYFAKLFKKWTGYTPVAYRAKGRGNLMPGEEKPSS